MPKFEEHFLRMYVYLALRNGTIDCSEVISAGNLTITVYLYNVTLTGLSELDDADEQDGSAVGRLASFRRPPADTDPLYMKSDKSETTVEHPPVTPDSRRDQRPEKPVVHFGVVGTGAPRDHQRRQYYLDENSVKAFDPGFQAVLESVEGNRKDSFILVRGICDYDDGTSADKTRRGDVDWRPYSALTAAGVMKCIILDIVAHDDDDDDD